jgi:hypothetical protein
MTGVVLSNSEFDWTPNPPTFIGATGLVPVRSWLDHPPLTHSQVYKLLVGSNDSHPLFSLSDILLLTYATDIPTGSHQRPD